MGIADRLVLDRAQPEPLGGVVGRLFQPAIVEHQHFGLPVFEEKLAVVGAFKPAPNDLGEPWTVQTGAIDQRNGGRGHSVLQVFCLSSVLALRRSAIHNRHVRRSESYT